MFVFAIYDKNKNRIFIARDRFGIKQIYYYLDENGKFYFASEIKAILIINIFNPNNTMIKTYLETANYDFAGILFDNIKRLDASLFDL